jgi:hypothetical protein
MPDLVPGIHVLFLLFVMVGEGRLRPRYAWPFQKRGHEFLLGAKNKNSWMLGPSPSMTEEKMTSKAIG